MLSRLALALVVLPCALLVQQAAAVKELSGWQSGISTHYGGAQDAMDPNSPSFGSKEGACGYGVIPKDQWPYFSVAALSPSNKFAQGDGLDGCGQCFQIQCESDMGGKADACIKDSKGKPKSILVQITDKCPECEADHIDVQSLAFAKLANPGLGRIKISYRRVECTPPDDLKVSVMDFAGGNGWLRLAIDDTGGRGAVTTVQVKGSSGGAWLPMSNSWGATWELSSAPQPPLDFKITTDDGEEVVASGVIKQNGGISGGTSSPIKFNTGTQFTITDPAVMTVRAAGGPDGNNDPMVATSDTPGNGGPAPTGSAPIGSVPGPQGSGSSSQCADVPPPGGDTCQQKKDWGQCGEGYMVQSNLCAQTCGRCQGGGGGSGGGEPKVQSFAGPSDSSPAPGGRKLLLRRGAL